MRTMKILIPVDGSPLALDAVRHALELVRLGLRAEFVLANVQEPASLFEMITTRDPEMVERASAEAGAHMLEPAIRLCRAAGAAFEVEVALGEPVNTLNDIVERFQCDAVVMGARGHGAISSALLGSVSQKMAHDALVPVTIVKHPLESEVDAADAADAADVDDAMQEPVSDALDDGLNDLPGAPDHP